MNPDKIAWALVAKADPDELLQMAEAAWAECFGDAAPAMEGAAVSDGRALVGEGWDVVRRLPSWSAELAARLGRSVLALDLRDTGAWPQVWEAPAPGRKGRSASSYNAQPSRRRTSAVVEARRVGLLPVPPPPTAIAIVDGAGPREVEDALARVNWTGVPLLAETHPRGTLLRTDPPSPAPSGAARKLGRLFPRTWSCDWSMPEGQFQVTLVAAGKVFLADWGGFAWGKNAEVLEALGVADSPDAVRAALQVTNPPGWTGA